MNLSALKDHLVSATAAAALLGGGAAIVTAKVDVAVHEQRIQTLEGLSSDMKALSADIADLRVELARKEDGSGK